MSLHHGLRATAGASPADPYFSSTSLLLLGNGTNGGQNNTFVDSSSNNLTITRYGNATQGAFSPFGYNWSNYFDGSGDYLSVSDNASLRMGTGNFTIEFWIYFTSISGYQTPLTKGYNVTGSLTFQTGNGDGKIVVYTGSPGTALMTVSTAATVNAWNHYALVRSGTTLTLYLNGSSVGTATNSTDFNSTGDLGIGSNLASFFYPITGYISNLRILKGTALYTSAFTPPTAPLSAITNTSLLTCQSNRFLDNSSNAFTITPYGDASVTNFAPFPTNSEYSTGVNGGSGYFDGSGDYLSIAANSAIQFGTGDYTIDFWVYPLQSGRQDMIDMPGTNRLQVAYEGTNTAIYINQTFIAGSAVAPTINAWNHIAATRLGTSTRVFLNGTQLGSTATNSTNFSDNSLKIVDTTSGTTPLKGYLAGLRVVKGGALYTASYTVPTAPPTTTVSSGTVGALLNFTNASIIDSTGKNDIETVGDAQISTAVKKFGTGSLKFDGTGDYLLIQNNSSFNFGSSDWTIEAWIYPTSISVDQQIYAKNEGSYPGGYEVVFLLTSGNKLQFASYGSSLFYAQSTGSISANVWTHVVAVRNGSTITLYINGTADGTATPQTIQSTTSRPTIGRDLESIGGGRYFTGYIDDLRITKGVARYTAAFTPPSRQLPAR